MTAKRYTAATVKQNGLLISFTVNGGLEAGKDFFAIGGAGWEGKINYGGRQMSPAQIWTMIFS